MDRIQHLHGFSDDAVRALAWSISTPSLMVDVPGMELFPPQFGQDAFEEAASWLKSLDQEPTPLHDYLGVRQTWKVGVYFEALVAFWLTWHPNYTLLGHNVQVRDAGRTLGAFDFLLRHTDGQVEHWEIAVKFYLERERKSDWASWVGPNQRDRLDIKLGRMREHQLPLSSRIEAKDALLSVGICEVPRQRALFKGRFFSQWQQGSMGPSGSREHEPSGAWIEAENFEAHSACFPGCRWAQRRKPDWLGPKRCSTSQTASANEVTDVDRPQLWSRLRQVDDDLWMEEGALFIVPNGWADQLT